MRKALQVGLLVLMVATMRSASAAPAGDTPHASPYPVSAVRLGAGPFKDAAAANREYLLALDADRLLAPFRTEAGLEPRKPFYGSWESGGLGGQTGGHYLSALSLMVALGEDTPDGELNRRLDYALSELAECQQAYGNGYVGGVPGSRQLWADVRAGNIDTHGFGLNGKWVPWYNIHKTFAGIRDAYVIAEKPVAKELLVNLGDWCVELMSHLDDNQMQVMMRAEHGGMNEVLADLYAITGDEKYLQAAQRFCHRQVLDPLRRHQDRLTGLHANTQIPKVIGLKRIGELAGDEQANSAAKFFWQTVSQERSLAFGGNSVAEHFNDPNDYSSVLERREGPETCNTYNMLRLTEQLFAAEPSANYIDFYERALYNHILAAINPEHPGFVYFTPIRPQLYRVYSTPENCFWCCVGTGIENPGRYGKLIYSAADDGGIYVNLFIASTLTASDNVQITQQTSFPDEPSTQLTLKLKQPASFALRVRHPAWVPAGEFQVRVNGELMQVESQPSSYAEISREWQNGDVVDVALPMHTTTERLPDGSDWVALLRGPIVLVAPAGTHDLVGLFADNERMAHVAEGELVPFEEVPVLLTTEEDLPSHVVPQSGEGPMHFELTDVVQPPVGDGVSLVPFFRLHEQRYQMYWELTTQEQMQARKQRFAAEQRAREALERATLDRVAIGEQQPEVEHQFAGSETESGSHQGRRWRHGKWFEYTLNTRGESKATLMVTYWGGDNGRSFDILVNGEKLASETLTASHPTEFFTQKYPIAPQTLTQAADGNLTIRFEATRGVAGGVYDLRLLNPSELPSESNP
ncbi:Non-reducing end beta-L-arabinofuranosidase [Aeoliella mucimassa]|uniref:Non-reducing end beta-L-arabinofuranosidase n=2 Tax=Aeoliella mucimassa TaxID=2527972 RepID=A0A518AK50_9BACT|nr:Non-reducing end beta-L-arabinofuranosidase [Aeoliella mucimassa]